MKRIQTKLWSHESIETSDRYYGRVIRKSQAKTIGSFPDLVAAVASITFNNPEYALFFRGQGKDYQDEGRGTTVLPTIYRVAAKSRERSQRISERFTILRRAETLIQNKFSAHGIEGYGKLKKYPQIAWAILQHYEVCKTPLLDLTHSLRVACSFALETASEYGVVHVLGFPNPNGSISYYVEEELQNIRLLSICPPAAKRPYHQEGYLVGSFPTEENAGWNPRFDAARRLVAKFQIPVQGFWNTNYTAIPREALYPSDDKVERICQEVKELLGRHP